MVIIVLAALRALLMRHILPVAGPGIGTAS
jgi:hypothetical protein